MEKQQEEVVVIEGMCVMSQNAVTLTERQKDVQQCQLESSKTQTHLIWERAGLLVLW